MAVKKVNSVAVEKGSKYRLLKKLEDVFWFPENPFDSELEPCRGIVQEIMLGKRYPGNVQEITAKISLIRLNSHRIEWKERVWWMGCVDAVTEHRPNALQHGDGFFVAMDEGFKIMEERDKLRMERLQRLQEDRRQAEQASKQRHRIRVLHQNGKSISDIATELDISGEQVAEEVSLLQDIPTR